MLNRYEGNSGRVVRIDDAQPPPRARPQAAAPGAFIPPPRPARKPPGLFESISGLVPAGIGELETEDILLLLILYLMYRESGDSELLIIMGAMFLL